MIFGRKWSFSRKLTLVNLGYALPCGVLVFFLIHDKNDQIEFNQKERLGVEMQRPLESLLEHVSRQKLLVIEQRSGKDVTARLAELQMLIERDFAALDDLSGFQAEMLQFTDAALSAQKKDRASPNALKSAWQGLTAEREKLDEEQSDERYNTLIADIRLGIGHVGDTSNLILDPDLDSYYLMDVSLLALPQIQDRLQEAISYVRGSSQTWPLPEAQKIKLHVLSTMIDSDLDRIDGSVQTAIAKDKDFLGVMMSLQKETPLALKEFLTATRAVSRQLVALTDDASGEGSQQDFYAVGDKAVEATGVFWTRVADELDKLLIHRVDTLVRAKWLALVLALFAWFPPAMIALWTIRRLHRSFKESVTKLEAEATTANTSSSHLAAASQTVSSGSTEQAAALQETGASMTEMASMVSRSSTQAVSSQELARKVKEQTDDGCQVIEQMVRSMESIEEANSQLQNISNIINDISEKTNIINDIVGKTQLLSFNASIEAARAGQHGRGFAVVAEEVGNLAQTSGKAAKEIRDLIVDSRQQVEHILKSTMDRVSEGKVVTERAQAIFGVIEKDISHISTQIESISEAAREQQFGIEQIAKAMTQMDQSTQANNSAALSAARLSDLLMSQSHKLTLIARSVSELVSGQARNKAQTAAKGDGTARPTNASDLGARLTTKRETEKSLKEGDSEKVAANFARLERELDRNLERAHEPDLAATGVDADDDSFKRAG